MKPYTLAVIIFISGKLLFAQLMDVNTIEYNVNNELIKSKVYLLEKSLNEHNNIYISGITSKNAKMPSMEGNRLSNYHNIRIKVIGINADAEIAHVICQNEYTFDNKDDSLIIDTLVMQKKNKSWTFSGLAELSSLISNNDKANKSFSTTQSSNWYNLVVPLYSDRVFIQKPYYKNPDIYEINSSITNQYLSRQLYDAGAEIDFACYTNSVNPDNTGQTAVFTLDNHWNRIVYSRNGSNDIKAYGSNTGDIHFINPTAIDVNEYGEVFVVDSYTRLIHKLQYTYDSNTLTYLGTMNISVPIDAPYDIEYSSEWTAFDKTDDIILITDTKRKSIMKFDINGNLLAEYKSFIVDGISYPIGYPTRISVGLLDYVQFIDASKNLIVTANISSANLECILGKPSKLPPVFNPIDIGCDANYNALVADNKGIVHKFDINGDYICSYKNPSLAFYNTRRISNSAHSYPGYILLDININDSWSNTKGAKRFLPGADVIDLQIIENEDYFISKCRFTDQCFYKIELIDVSNNTAILSKTGETNWGGESNSFNISKNSLNSGDYKVKVSVLPYNNQVYGDYSVDWKYREITFHYTKMLKLSFKPIIWDGQSGAYYKDENSGKIDNVFNIPQGTSISIRAYTPAGSNFIAWSDGNTSNPRTFNLSSSLVDIYAIIKLHKQTTSLSAFSTNSQRKVIRDEDGRLNMVYESVGYVWLTTSSDNGATWSPEIKLSYSEFPSSGTASKCPSIVQADDNSGKVYVAYQFNYGDNSSGIAISAFFNGSEIWTALVEGTGISYSYDCKPVIAFHSGSISIVYRKSSLNGLYLANILLNPTSSLHEPQSPTISEITNTTTSSSNPSIGFGYTSQNYKFYLAYQEGSTAIKYISFSPGTVPSTGATSVSASGGYTYNTNPSIIQLGDGARITWKGYNSTGNAAAVFKDPDYSRYWNFDAGNGISSSSVTRTADGNYVIAWTLQNSTTNRFVINSDFNNIRTFKNTSNVNLAGNLQVANGSAFTDMYAMSLNTQTSPYSFQLSKKVSDIGTSKISAEETVCRGRGAVVHKDNAEVYFSLNDITADGAPVEFVEAEDTLKITETGRLNSYLETRPFSVNSNSEILYGISYGVVDSSALASILTDNAYVNFRVELADANTNAVLSTLENTGYSKSNIPAANEKAVRLNLADIGTRQVILRVILNDNIQAGYALVDKISSVENVSKANIQNAKYDGVTVVKEYNLEQNYPNPFNPVTTINYQLPKDGMVTLKIYDAIGTEVTTLVHEYKQAGRYNVNFNASGLASGVYFYRLQVNDFTSSKKLILMK
jgi:hypothetical protein